MNAVPEDEIDSGPARVIPRKLSLRVSGAKLGSRVRPTVRGALAAVASPARPSGLRVHLSALPPGTTSVESFDPSEYATADDYE